MNMQRYSATKDQQHYTNPLLFGNYADPSIVRHGDDYYMVHGGYPNCSTHAMLLWHSKDLVNWSPMYYIAKQQGLFDKRIGYAWAPELVFHQNVWYLYNYGLGVGTYVMTCTDIQSDKWSDPIHLPQVEGIDPGHVVDTDGKRYLCMSRNILYPLSDDGLSIIGQGIKIAGNCAISDDVDIEGMCTESPKLRYKDGYFYLTVAQGGTWGPPTSHGIFSLRSKSLLGPYEQSPYNPVCHTNSRKEAWWSKGHGSLIDTPEGNWYMVYHAVAQCYPCFGRMTMLQPVQWTDDDWYIMPDQASDTFLLPRAACPLTEQKNNESLFWNAFDAEVVQRSTWENGALTFVGQGKDERHSAPWVYTQSYFEYEVNVKLTLLEDGSCGALSLYSSATHHFGLTLCDGQLYIHNCGRNWYQNNAVPYQQDFVYLRLRLKDGVASAWYSEDGSIYHKINYCADISCWCANSGAGSAIQPALLSMKQGKVCFSEFSIRSIRI